MAITLNSTAGDPSANSYVSLVEANTYLEAHLKASSWSVLDDERKKAALISATRALDSMRFGGRKASQTQSLLWPRQYIYDYENYLITGIPKQLKDAECELAIWMLTEDDRIAGQFELETMDSVEIGPIKYKIKSGYDAEIIPSYIEDLLEMIGPGAVVESDSSVSVMVQ